MAPLPSAESDIYALFLLRRIALTFLQCPGPLVAPSSEPRFASKTIVKRLEMGGFGKAVTRGLTSSALHRV